MVTTIRKYAGRPWFFDHGLHALRNWLRGKIISKNTEGWGVPCEGTHVKEWNNSEQQHQSLEDLSSTYLVTCFFPRIKVTASICLMIIDLSMTFYDCKPYSMTCTGTFTVKFIPNCLDEQLQSTAYWRAGESAGSCSVR